MSRLTAAVLTAALLTVTTVEAQDFKPSAPGNYISHGIAMHGDMKYLPGAKHFDYANPDAPKGGEIRYGARGTFDTFNPYILKGNPAPVGNETLMINSGDEPFSEYGLLAESIETPPDRSWAIFTLRPEARWQDGKPVVADDVVFSFNILKEKGRPQYKIYYASVVKAEKLEERKVKFTFAPGENRELPLIIGQLPILPKHYWATRDFDKTTQEPPLTSGPYKVAKFDAPRSMVLERDPNNRGKDLWLNRGRNNFQTIRYEFFRDDTVLFEAFKAGQFDVRRENISRNWATGYNFPAATRGLVKKDEIPHSIDEGTQMYAFNLRRPELFGDRKVRMAFSYLFDFEWSNKNLFYGAYKRAISYFSNSELAATGLPTGEELKILEKYRGKIPDEVFTKPFTLPVTDGSGENREGLRAALTLFKEAGWEIDKTTKKLTNTKTGKVMSFEIMLDDASFERPTLPFVQQLQRVGIDVRVRTVDAAQYQRRNDDFDYDMVIARFGQSESPGNEQRDMWGSKAADEKGSYNSIGIKDPVVDELVELVIAAPDRASLVARTRALDRVLQWGYYGIPHWYIDRERVAYWDRFSRPKQTAKYSPVALDTWWFDAAKDAALKDRQSKGEDK
jgi:microcin C transport system substrate-binding protein